MQTIFIHLINGEKFYNNLAFLNHKTITKVTLNKKKVFTFKKTSEQFVIQSKDKYYDSASPLLDQIVKENNLGHVSNFSISNNPISNMSSYDAISTTSIDQSSMHSLVDKSPVDNLLSFIDSLSQFIEFRHQMMKLQLTFQYLFDWTISTLKVQP